MHGYNKEDWLQLLSYLRFEWNLPHLTTLHHILKKKHADIVDNIFCFASH